MADSNAQLLTCEDVANRLRMSTQAFYALRHRGNGPRGARIGKRVLFHPDEVNRFLESLLEEPRAS